MNQHQMTDAGKILEFIFAGKAVFTLRSAVTGVRYTYKIRKGELVERKLGTTGPTKECWFVMVLTGPDNTADWTYAGMFNEQKIYRVTRASKMGLDAPSIVALKWALGQFNKGQCGAGLEFYHEGHCGRCGRVLTVPESLVTGLGPDCAGIMGITQATLPLGQPAAPPATPQGGVNWTTYTGYN